MARTVCIVSWHESWQDAPWGDPSVEYWVYAPMIGTVPRADRWYEVHQASEIARCALDARTDRYLERLAATTVPIYMIDPLPTYPSAVRYPLQTVRHVCDDYLVGSIGLMLAHAVTEHVEGHTIHKVLVYGVQLAHDLEYQDQLPCATYYIGLLRGLGVAVEVAPTSRLCKAGRIYGYGTRTRWAHLFDHGFMRGLSGEVLPQVQAGMTERAAWIAEQKRRHVERVGCD